MPRGLSIGGRGAALPIGLERRARRNGRNGHKTATPGCALGAVLLGKQSRFAGSQMRRRIQAAVLGVLALFLAIGDLSAAQKARTAKQTADFSSTEHVLKWINAYRKKPDPKHFDEAVRAMFAFQLFKDVENAGVYIGFMGGVIGSDPAKAEQTVTSLFPMAPEDQAVLIKAISFSGLPDWKDLLKRFVERMPARKVMLEKYLYGKVDTLAEVPLDTGAFALDANWGYYFATGSPVPIRRIITALEWAKEKNSVEKLTAGSMARWTLAQNASRDMDLLRLLKQEYPQVTGEARPVLKDVIEAAETFEVARIRKDALKSIDELKSKGPQSNRDMAWWGQAGQTVLALGCVAAGAMGHVEFGIPCVVGGAVSTAALKYLIPGASTP